MAADPNSKPRPEPPRGNGYERRDANGKWILGIVIGLLLSVVAAQLVLSRVKAGLEKTTSPTDRWAGARPAPTSVWAQASFPRLQVSPPADLKAFRVGEDKVLDTYGWVDRTAGVVRIPIERAMDLLANRGLPVRAGIGQSRLGPTPLELQQQRTNATAPETQLPLRGAQ